MVLLNRFASLCKDFIFAYSSFYNILESQKRKEKLAKLALAGALEESLSEKIQVSLVAI